MMCRHKMSRSFYDDNFGFYDIRDEDDIEFYREMQRISVRKKCQGCGRMVKISQSARVLQWFAARLPSDEHFHSFSGR